MCVNTYNLTKEKRRHFMWGKEHRKIMQAEMIMVDIVSYGCCKKLPQTGWLKIIETYSPIVPEARSLKARCQ